MVVWLKCFAFAQTSVLSSKELPHQDDCVSNGFLNTVLMYTLRYCIVHILDCYLCTEWEIHFVQPYTIFQLHIQYNRRKLKYIQHKYI